jgi:tetratricopeptide (TPR) repeat protein
MNQTCAVILSLGLVFAVEAGAAGMNSRPPEQAEEYKPTAEFTAAENVVDGLVGTPADDPESQAKLEQARALFQKVLAQFPKTTLALNYLGKTYSFEGQDRKLGIAALEKSLAIDPDQPNTIVNLIGLCLDAGQREKAGEEQARYVKASADHDLVARVERLVGQWDAQQGQRLIDQGHAEQGFALMDKAIREVSDPSVKEDLRNMRNQASRVWEVTLYNDALSKAKAKDYRGSWDILEKLIPVAKDPEVVERAKRLRDKLAPVVGARPSQ